MPLPFSAPWNRSASPYEVATVPAGEESKSLAQASQLYERMLRLPADRHTVVVALGGGVIGDLAGFVAATFARGVPLFMVPTSLLAQVDSSVGGKVGINLPDAKNIVGAFHQPAGVWIDVGGLADTARPGASLRPGRGGQVRRDSRRSVFRRCSNDPSSRFSPVIPRACEPSSPAVAS